MKIIGIIPARYASTRFPGKPLALIAGMTLVQRVVEQCQKAKSLSDVIVATAESATQTLARSCGWPVGRRMWSHKKKPSQSCSSAATPRSMRVLGRSQV